MTIKYFGPFIRIYFEANEVPANYISVELADDGNKYSVIPSDQFK